MATNNRPVSVVRKKFKVGVFGKQGRKKTRHSAYTTWYNPEWKGCCEHYVFAENGKEAKEIAIAQHKENCQVAGERS